MIVTPGTGAAAISDVTVNFGDGARSTVDLGAVSGTINVSHAYASAGSVHVDGHRERRQRPDRVGLDTGHRLRGDSVHPVGHGVSEHRGVQRHAGGVHGHAQRRSAPSILNYSWDFGDGNEGADHRPVRVVTPITAVPNGTPSQQLLVSVTATGADGRVGYGSVAITVTQ